MKLINYLPYFLSNVLEFKELFNSEDIELENLRAGIDSILKEVIVNTAESYGLERYEKIFNITNISPNIDTRRINILLKMNNNVPPTYKWLLNKLNELVGEGNYKITPDFNNYKLRIDFLLKYTEAGEIIKQELKRKMPANIELTATFYTKINLAMGGNIKKIDYQKINVILEEETKKDTINNVNVNGANISSQDYSDIFTDNTIEQVSEKLQMKSRNYRNISQQNYEGLISIVEIKHENHKINQNNNIGAKIQNVEHISLSSEINTESQEKSLNQNNKIAIQNTHKEYLKIEEVEK